MCSRCALVEGALQRLILRLLHCAEGGRTTCPRPGPDIRAGHRREGRDRGLGILSEAVRLCSPHLLPEWAPGQHPDLTPGWHYAAVTAEDFRPCRETWRRTATLPSRSAASGRSSTYQP